MSRTSLIRSCNRDQRKQGARIQDGIIIGQRGKGEPTDQQEPVNEYVNTNHGGDRRLITAVSMWGMLGRDDSPDTCAMLVRHDDIINDNATASHCVHGGCPFPRVE